MPEVEEHDGLVVVRDPEQQPDERIDHPAKLLRIAAMTRQLLDEVRAAPLDERSRERLKEIYDSSLQELRETLPEDLKRELATLTHPLDEVPSESEIRVAQAQLVGWLEGLFHGIQAALWTEAMQAQAQFRAMPHRALPPGVAPQGMPQERTEQQQRESGYI